MLILATLARLWLRNAQAVFLFCVFMNFPVTLATQGDQVALGICALMAPESPVMNFDC
jgi:hypothetical protein